MNDRLNPWPWATPEPGVYFNMPFEEYCAIPALNAGTMKKMMVSCMDAWMTTPWINPNADDSDDDTTAKIEGRAYHAYILEGPDVFAERFAQEYRLPEGVLSGKEAMGKALRALGVKFQASIKAEDMSALLLTKDPTAKTYISELARHQKANEGRDFIAPETVLRVKLADQMIRHHPDMRTYFAGGYPEVTVIWDDLVYGVRFKIRFDYLRIARPSDLKSFANVMKKPVKVAVRNAIRQNLYWFQMALYMRGAQVAQSAIRHHKYFGHEDVDPAWLKMYADRKIEGMNMGFVQKQPSAPTVYPVFMSADDQNFVRRGADALSQVTSDFKRCWNEFGTSPWLYAAAEDRIYSDEIGNQFGDM